MSKDLIIQLGPHGVRYSNPTREDVKLLGTIQEGQAIGALAVRADGRYVQLNGDFERLLNTSRVKAAMRRQPGWYPVEPKAPAAPPIVTIKRRRVLMRQE
jgi:hypothetical protein